MDDLAIQRNRPALRATAVSDGKRIPRAEVLIVNSGVLRFSPGVCGHRNGYLP